MRIGKRIVLLVLSAATLVSLSPTSSTDNHGIAVGSGTASPGAAGMRAYLDPETGELVTGPLPASVVQLDAETENALRHDSEGLELKRHADGSVSMDLQGRFQSATVARVDENGVVTICSDNAEAVERSLNQNVVHSTTPEVK